jgi:hypothetical protein
MNRILLLVIICLVSGCATANGGTSLPYDAWSLKFVAPNSMEVWVETADIQDVHGRVFLHVNGGTAAISYGGDATGWPMKLGASQGRNVTDASLPTRIFVRWQSLVEPQTYRVTLNISEEVRQLMLSRELQPRYLPEQRWQFRENLVVGLAPGGVVKLWVRGPGLQPIEVLCQRAEIEQRGPDLGLFEGRYVTLPAESKEYLRTHPIPYDSWKCR